MSERILLVEDESGVARPIVDRLESEGYAVECVEEGDRALRRARTRLFSVIVLDVMLPGSISGLDVIQRLRADGVRTPILVLSALDEVSDRVVGLRLGADDYLAKPFAMPELVARIEALLRRRQSSPARRGMVRLGSVEIDLDAGRAHRGDVEIELSAREFQLLRYFLGHPDQLLTREQLLHDVWGYARMPESRTVDVHVARLREKLEDDRSHPRFFLTLRGTGYRFRPPPIARSSSDFEG